MCTYIEAKTCIVDELSDHVRHPYRLAVRATEVLKVAVAARRAAVRAAEVMMVAVAARLVAIGVAEVLKTALVAMAPPTPPRPAW